MVNQGEESSRLEQKVKMGDNGSAKILVPNESGLMWKVCLGLTSKLWVFWVKVWGVGVDDPRRVIHCLKVGLALTIVSVFYYIRPLYQGVGGNAMWAILTVVVVFEYTVGATLCKSLNRAVGTFLAGALAIGIHWVASHCGENFEAVIVRTSVFLLASAATFSRFIPIVKARFDYGAMIFILTFSLVSVSGYRVNTLFELARDRISTVVIGTSICVLVVMLICPIWAGEDLHLLVVHNLEKLADSLDECVFEYFKDDTTLIENDEERCKRIYGYKYVLNSKGLEDSLANFARWEPSHGRFSFRHPWNQYLKIGTLTRNCACCIEALNSCISSEIQADEMIKKHLSNVCKRLSSHSSIVLKELTIIIKTMKKSSTIDFLIAEMNIAVKDLQNSMKCLPTQIIPPPPKPLLPLLVKSLPEKEIRELISTTNNIPLMEVLPLVSVTSLLIKISARIEGIAHAVDELGSMAGFSKATKDENKARQNKTISSDV